MISFDSLPDYIQIREVGPREGFQSEKLISTEQKVALINSLTSTGISSIQVASLVHPKVVPQHADAEEVMARINRPQGVQFTVLVPNIKGAERALTTNADEWNLMLSVSDSHSRANANCTTEEALKRMEGILKLAHDAGVHVTGGMGTALGCPFEGRIPLSRLIQVVETYLELGITSISVADTSGMADPVHVYRTMKGLIERFPAVKFKLHLHNTRGMGLANVIAGIQAGVRIFESSIGGLGGCPFAPGASGNVATEDLVHMLELMGIKTNIELNKLIKIARDIPNIFNRAADSFVSVAGASSDLHELVSTRIANSKNA